MYATIPCKFLNLLINTYVKFKPEHDVQNSFPFGLLFEYDTDIYYIDGKRQVFSEYETELMSNPQFVKKLDCGKYTLYIFEFPEEYKKEYKNFLLGRYSKFSVSAKTKIIDFSKRMYGGSEIVTEIVHVLYKNKFRKQRLERELGISIPWPLVL